MLDPFLKIVQAVKEGKPNTAYRQFKSMTLEDRTDVINKGLVENDYKLTASARIEIASELLGVMMYDVQGE